MKSQVKEISKRFKTAQIGLRDILSIIDVTLDDHIGEQATLYPYEVFEGLNELIDRTTHGTRIERFRPRECRQPFHTFELHTKNGEVLGYLNMVYLSKPIPCYYLVYAEIMVRFRGRGLGNNILKAYKEFAENEKAVALLDNIIPPGDPTYTIYAKLGWKPVEELVGDSAIDGKGHYMVFIPSSIKTRNLKAGLLKVLIKVRKKRPIIDMYDNESMVQRTIGEFQSLYKALECLFTKELLSKTSTPLMRFMFTKFVTKVLGFRRRIATLLGYTGGESLEQISISGQIKALTIQPYSLWTPMEDKARVWGNEEIMRSLPETLKKKPTSCIEALPVYKRPYLLSSTGRKRTRDYLNLKISDLLELGFDPTKLRAFHHEGTDYIFERVSAGFVASIEKKRRFLQKIGERVSGMRFRSAMVQINPPLVILQERGNSYVLRRRVDGIHLDEALHQLRTSPLLKEMNRAVGIDRAILATVHEITDRLLKVFGPKRLQVIDDLVFFVPWDLERNDPKVIVDISSVTLRDIWLT
ncbi:MAG: hypothetical protein NTX75_05425 [Proteobacteria bacterium]|nr:hypothetical protein [Pseudomonadota bacterium]